MTWAKIKSRMLNRLSHADAPENKHLLSRADNDYFCCYIIFVLLVFFNMIRASRAENCKSNCPYIKAQYLALSQWNQRGMWDEDPGNPLSLCELHCHSWQIKLDSQQSPSEVCSWIAGKAAEDASIVVRREKNFPSLPRGSQRIRGAQLWAKSTYGNPFAFLDLQWEPTLLHLTLSKSFFLRKWF